MTPLERVQRLIQRLSASREQTIKLLREGVGTGNTMAYLRGRLTSIEKELAKANKLLQEELQRIARDSYTRAALDGLRTVGMQAAEIERLRKDGVDAVKAAIEDRAKLFDPTIPTIGRIEYDKRIQARAAMESVGRQIEDVVRRETMEVVVRQTSDRPIAPKEAAKDLMRRLEGYGGTGVRYRNNRIMPYDKYAAMVARTTEREANNTGFIQVAIVAGTGLVKMTAHSPTCPICAPRQGRIYRVMDFPEGDERNGFPYIDMALPGWPQYV